MRGPARIIAVGLAVGLLSACAEYTTTGVPQDSSSATTTGADSLAGTSWSLSDATLGAEQDIASLGITAGFSEGTMAGRAPVNTYSTSYRVEGSALRLGPVASTRMAGTPEAMAAEQAYFDVLGTVTSFRVEDGQLFLLGTDQQVLTYAPNGGAVKATPAASDVQALKATTEFAATLIGTSTADAQAAAEAAGHEFRVISEDGQARAVSSDYLPTRVNVTVVDGRVTEATAG